MRYVFDSDIPAKLQTPPREVPGRNANDEWQKLLDQKHEIKISTKEIIQLAYSHMELLLRYPNRQKFRDEQARAYSAIFCLVVDLLKQVERRVLEGHPKIRDFYRLQLERDDDRLSFSEDPLTKFG